MKQPTTPDHWEIGYYADEKWRFKGEHPDPSSAICALVFERGEVLHAEREDNGTYRVTDLAGNTVACVRRMTHALPGDPGLNGNGPLRRWRGLTWVGWLNFLVLRWFLFRVYYVVETDGTISKYGMRFIPSWRW